MGVNRKISGFTKDTTPVASTDYLTFVRSGTNYQMLLSDFIASLGVTGTIVQDGAVTGTPVLDVDGTINNIRNLEAGDGITTSVSAENGITIRHNFAADKDGEPCMVKETTAEPVIVSLVAGEGVELTSTGDHIQIDFTGIPTDVVVVNALADFPTAVAGVITLAADTGYQISGDIAALTNRFVFGENTVIFGTDSAISSITYTGTGVMWTNVEDSCKITKVELFCENGTLFDITSTSGNGVFQFVNSTISACDTLGTIGDLAALQWTDVATNSQTTDGLTFTGTIGVFIGTRNLFVATGGTVLDLASCSFTIGWTLESTSVVLAAGTTFLDGLASSGNIASGALGTLFNTRFSGAGTPVGSNIVSTDARWQFFGNDDVSDSLSDGMVYMKANATETTIAVQGTPVLIAGTWTVKNEHRFTGTTAGRLTYTGEKIASFDLNATLTADPASGVNQAVAFHPYLNGAEITDAEQTNTITSGSPRNTGIVWHLDMAKDDYLEIYVANDSTTNNITVSDVVLRLS